MHVSSAQTSHIEYNTTGKFAVDLREILDAGEDNRWEVGVTYLTLPLSWNNIDDDSYWFQVTMLTDVLNITRDTKGISSGRIFLPKGTYSSAEDIVTTLNSLLPISASAADYSLNSQKMIKFIYVPSSRLIVLRFIYKEEAYPLHGLRIHFNRKLMRLCAFPQKVNNPGLDIGFPNPVVTSLAPVDMPFPVSQINITCNIVDMEITSDGSKRRGLFTSFATKRPPGSTDPLLHIIPDEVQYKNIVSRRFDQMTFDILDQEGEPVKFAEDSPPTYLGLHFRRKS